MVRMVEMVTTQTSARKMHNGSESLEPNTDRPSVWTTEDRLHRKIAAPPQEQNGFFACESPRRRILSKKNEIHGLEASP
jgi:hypothetical protein